jgi:cobalt-zinc-cadmium efflux system outer membrane protein
MRMPVLALACVLAAWSFTPRAQTPAPLTLPEALRLAESAHPTVRAREAQRAAADGARREAAAPLFNNPELSLEQARRRAPDGRANEWSVGIAQPLEIAGQQSGRRTVAAHAHEALDAEIADARRHARAEAAARFHAVLAVQRRVSLEQRAVQLSEATAQAVARRRSAGEDTRLDANVAQIEAERARNALAAAREQLLDARSELGTALQLPPSTLPDVSGELMVLADAASPYSIDQLLQSARSAPRLRALAAREEAAKARAGVERGARYPDVTVGLNVGREGRSDARERVTTLSISVPLPLFKRNDAAIGRALSDATQAELDRAAAARDAQAQVRRLWSRLQSQRERVHRLQSTVMAASSDNQQLAAKSRQAGQIGLLDQVQVNRQAIDAERELTDALSEFHTTRIELELAAAWPQEGSTR